jgi:hypothetical protein
MPYQSTRIEHTISIMGEKSGKEMGIVVAVEGKSRFVAADGYLQNQINF